MTREMEEDIETDMAAKQEVVRRLFLGILMIWPAIILTAAAGLWTLDRRRRRAEEGLREANEALACQAEELAAHRERLAEMVSHRTAQLRIANRILRSEIEKHRDAERKVKVSGEEICRLSASLIHAQEV